MTDVQEVEGLAELGVRAGPCIMIRKGLDPRQRRDVLAELLVATEDKRIEPPPAPRRSRLASRVVLSVLVLTVVGLVATNASDDSASDAATPFDQTWSAINRQMHVTCHVRDRQASCSRSDAEGELLSWTTRVATSSDGTSVYITPLRGEPPMTMLAFVSDEARDAWLVTMPELHAAVGERFVVFGGPASYLQDVVDEAGATMLNPQRPTD